MKRQKDKKEICLEKTMKTHINIKFKKHENDPGKRSEIDVRHRHRPSVAQ